MDVRMSGWKIVTLSDNNHEFKGEVGRCDELPLVNKKPTADAVTSQKHDAATAESRGAAAAAYKLTSRSFEVSCHANVV